MIVIVDAPVTLDIALMDEPSTSIWSIVTLFFIRSLFILSSPPVFHIH